MTETIWIFGKKKYEKLVDSMEPGDAMASVHYGPLPLYKVKYTKGGKKKCRSK